MPLSKRARSPHSPSPIYGIRPGFTVGDLDSQYQPPKLAIGNDPSIGGVGYSASGTSAPITVNRVVKIGVIVGSATPTDHVDVAVTSAIDNYVAVIASYTALKPGSYTFYLGGWASPSSDATSYPATQYGPPTTDDLPSATDPSGNQETTDLDPANSSNYMGGTYNPVQFLSLDGYSIQISSLNFVGSPNVTVTVEPVS